MDHLLGASMWKELLRTVCSLRYCEARACLGVFSLSSFCWSLRKVVGAAADGKQWTKHELIQVKDIYVGQHVHVDMQCLVFDEWDSCTDVE